MLFRRYSLHKRLLLVFSVLGTALVCLSIFLNTLIGRSFKQDISERNLRLASSIASQVEVTLTHHGDELWQLFQNITQAPAGDPIVQKMMRSTLSYHPLIERIYLLDKNGRVLRVVPDNPHLLGLDMSNQPYYTERDTVLNYVLWNDAYISSEIGRQTVAMSIYTGDLTLAAHLYLDELGEIIRSEYPVTEGFVTIIDGKGMPIAGADEQMDTTGINFLELTSVRNALGGIEGSYDELIGGERGLSSACLIQNMGWAVLIFQPKAGTFGAVDRLLKLTSIVLLLAFVVAMLISLGLLKRIMNPIRNLVTQTRSVASGGYNVSVKTEYEEFQELAESFNQMARSIEAREDELKISESRYRELFYNNPLPVMIFDAEDLTILDVSLAAVEDYGYSRDEFIGMSMLQIRLKEEVQSASQIIRTENTGMRKAGTWKHSKKDGSVIYVDITSHEIPYMGKRAILCICRDVTSNILVEEALRESQERQRATLESIGDAIIILDPELNVTWVNRHATNRLGYIVDEKCHIATRGSDEPCESCPAINSLRDQRTYRTEENMTGPDGVSKTYFVNTSPMYDNWGHVMGVVKSFRDITDQKKSEELLLESLAEKEVLLKEVHHRVKNNLQAISGLIDMQSNFTSDLWTKKVLQDSQNRILSMALIHEKLYEVDGISRIDFGDYINYLMKHLARIYDVKGQGIEFDLSYDEVLLNVDTALPCGLIITELVSNSLKHAFPNGGGGRVNVQLKNKGMEQFVLSIEDDGVGMDFGLDHSNNNSLGLQLVRSYVEFLSGTFEVPEGKGARFRITFSEYDECPIEEL